MKNLAILVPTLNCGGAERVASNLSIILSKHYNVFVIVHDASNIIYPYEGTLINLNLPSNKGILRKIITVVKRTIKLNKIKKIHKIHYTISHLPSSNLINVLSRCDDKVFTYVHSMLGAEKGISIIDKVKERFISCMSDKVIVVSERARLNLIENFGISYNKAVTIYNFLDEEGIKRKLDNIDSDEQYEDTIVCMGRITTAKGHWHLLRAFSKVVKSIPQAKLIILGEGELRESLELLAKKLDIEKNIDFIGFTSNPFRYIKKSKLFVSSSLWEGLPMALIEAARCGKAIISTDCDAGCREIISPDTNLKEKAQCIEFGKYGILVPVFKENSIESINVSKEEEIMADAIILLMNDEKLRERYEKLSEELYKRFLPETIIKEWSKLFNLIDKEKNYE